MLGKKGLSVTLLDVIERIEGPILLNKCLGGRGICSSDSNCKVHQVWYDIQSDIKKKLKSISLADLI